MKKSRSIFYLGFLTILLFLFVSCDGNYSNIKIVGKIIDKTNGGPVTNGNVIIKCWVYDTKLWESRPVEKISGIDKDGTFQIEFEKGEAIDIIVQSSGYLDYNQSITLDKSRNVLDIQLSK